MTPLLRQLSAIRGRYQHKGRLIEARTIEYAMQIVREHTDWRVPRKKRREAVKKGSHDL